MEEVELAELPPPPAEPIAEPEKKKRAKKDDAPKPKVVRRKKIDEQPGGMVDTQPSFVPPALDAGFFQQLGKELRELEVQSRQKRLSSLSIV